MCLCVCVCYNLTTPVEDEGSADDASTVYWPSSIILTKRAREVMLAHRRWKSKLSKQILSDEKQAENARVKRERAAAKELAMAAAAEKRAAKAAARAEASAIRQKEREERARAALAKRE